MTLLFVFYSVISNSDNQILQIYLDGRFFSQFSTKIPFFQPFRPIRWSKKRFGAFVRGQGITEKFPAKVSLKVSSFLTIFVNPLGCKSVWSLDLRKIISSQNFQPKSRFSVKLIRNLLEFFLEQKHRESKNVFIFGPSSFIVALSLIVAMSLFGQFSKDKFHHTKTRFQLETS